MSHRLQSTVEALYDSEINVSLVSFYDAGWTVKIGDEVNGWLDEEVTSDLDEAAVWLDDKARAYFPDSEYARRRKR